MSTMTTTTTSTNTMVGGCGPYDRVTISHHILFLVVTGAIDLVEVEAVGESDASGSAFCALLLALKDDPEAHGRGRSVGGRHRDKRERGGERRRVVWIDGIFCGKNTREI